MRIFLLFISIVYFNTNLVALIEDSVEIKKNYLAIGLQGGYMFKSEPFTYTSLGDPYYLDVFIMYPISVGVERLFGTDKALGVSFDRVHYKYSVDADRNKQIGEVEAYAFNMLQLNWIWKNRKTFLDYKLSVDIPLSLGYRWGMGERVVSARNYGEPKQAYHSYDSWGISSGINLNYYFLPQISLSIHQNISYFNEKFKGFDKYSPSIIDGYTPSRFMYSQRIMLALHF